MHHPHGMVARGTDKGKAAFDNFIKHLDADGLWPRPR
jgi:hypothetical protein